MSQIALPLGVGPGRGPARIIVGPSNAQVLEALASPETWPFRTAVLSGPRRSGKSLMARWFQQAGNGEVIDGADGVPETELFHRWNRAQESATPLLLVIGSQNWDISLPDLRSRVGAGLHLAIGQPEDPEIEGLLAAHAEQRGLVLGESALTYLALRTARSFAEIEALAIELDRLSLERKQAPTLSICRDALEAVKGIAQPRLL
jgi:hypothetical protein